MIKKVATGGGASLPGLRPVTPHGAPGQQTRATAGRFITVSRPLQDNYTPLLLMIQGCNLKAV